MPKQANKALSLGPLDEALPYRLYRIGRLLRQHQVAFLERVGIDLTPEQYFVLYRLCMHPDCAQGSLADPVLGDYPNITRQIDALVAKGLAMRQSDPEDRRKHRIQPSKKAIRIMQDASAAILEERDRLFGDWPNAQAAAFAKGLLTLEKTLTH